MLQLELLQCVLVLYAFLFAYEAIITPDPLFAFISTVVV